MDFSGVMIVGFLLGLSIIPNIIIILCIDLLLSTKINCKYNITVDFSQCTVAHCGPWLVFTT